MIDYLDYIFEYYYGLKDYFSDYFWSNYDGWMLGLYMYLNQYDWSNGRESESFGACIGARCGGMWAYAYYYQGETYYEFSPINFYEDGAGMTTPDVPYAYDEAYYQYYYYLMPFGYDNLSYVMNEYSYTTLWSMISADSSDYQNGDDATVVAWSSLSTTNQVQTVTLAGTEKSGAFAIAVSSVLVAMGAAALF